MKIGERQIGDVIVLDICGRIAGANAVEMIEAAMRRIHQGTNRNVVVNLGNVRSIDGVALGGLVAACRAVRQAGSTLRLAGITNRMHDLLVITRLLTAFEAFDSIEEAIGATPMLPGAAAAQGAAIGLGSMPPRLRRA